MRLTIGYGGLFAHCLSDTSPGCDFGLALTDLLMWADGAKRRSRECLEFRGEKETCQPPSVSPTDSVPADEKDIRFVQVRLSTHYTLCS